MLITLRLTIYSETTYASHMSVLTVALTKMHAKDMTPGIELIHLLCLYGMEHFGVPGHLAWNVPLNDLQKIRLLREG
jgi:hypothetical protein